MNPFSDHPAVRLLPEGAVFLTDSAALVLSDVHLGKAAAFRAKGIPVPEGDTAADVERMLALVRSANARQLVVAGDLFHAPAGITPEIEAAIHGFLAQLGIPLLLVTGNHDAKIRHLPAGIPSLPVLALDGVRIVHDPKDAQGPALNLCGHWHPLVKIPDGKRTSLRLPCFLRRDHLLVMPSFGTFTGGAIIPSEPGDRHFVSLHGTLIELPEELLRRRS